MHNNLILRKLFNRRYLIIHFRMYSHPQGGRFISNITSIPGQSYAYHTSAAAHQGLQHVQITPSTALNQTGPSFAQPQTTNAVVPPSPAYHATLSSAASTPVQPHYISPAEAIQPIQTQSISIKLEKSVEDTTAGAFQRVPNNLNWCLLQCTNKDM